MKLRTCTACPVEFRSRHHRKYCTHRCAMTARMVAPEIRFWAMVNKDDKDCWLWTGCVNNKGYGMFYPETIIGKRRRPAVLSHRYSWQCLRGPITAGLCVLHKCDTPRCVNPDHLFLGTQFDNLADARAKGRIRHDKLTGRILPLNT
jgi:hypothetical protein